MDDDRKLKAISSKGVANIRGMKSRFGTFFLFSRLKRTILMKVKFALHVHFEEPLLVLYSVIQSVVTCHKNTNVVRLIQMQNKMSKHLHPTIR